MRLLNAQCNMGHRLRTCGEEIAFTARPKIQSQSEIYRYGRSIFCLPHRPNISGFFDLCLHWVSVVRDTYYLQLLKNTHAIHSRQLARKQTLGNFRKIGKLATTGSTTTSHSLGGRRGLRMIQVVAAALFGITMHVYGIVVYEVG